MWPLKHADCDKTQKLKKLHLKNERATGPVLTSVKEEKHIILHTTLNIAVRRGKLRTYTLQNTPKVFWKFAPSGGYKECAVACFAKMERLSSFIKKCEKIGSRALILVVTCG